LDGPHLPDVLGDQHWDPDLARLLEVRMFAPEPPERMGPTGESSHLGLVGQRSQITVAGWKHENWPPGPLALQGDDPVRERWDNLI
jgi:hypothetical protein